MTTTNQPQWPDDPVERIEAKLDHYHTLIHGDPANPARPGIDGRLRTVEREWGLAKRGALSLLTLGLPAAWAAIKGKFGNQ